VYRELEEFSPAHSVLTDKEVVELNEAMDGGFVPRLGIRGRTYLQGLNLLVSL